MNQISGKTIALSIAILFVLLSGIVGVGAVVKGLQEVRGETAATETVTATTEEKAATKKWLPRSWRPS